MFRSSSLHWVCVPELQLSPAEGICQRMRCLCGPMDARCNLIKSPCVKEKGMDSNGMKRWRGTSDARSLWELKGGSGTETQGGNMLPCQPSNFSNRRKLVMSNYRVGILREKYALWKWKGYIFDNRPSPSPREILCRVSLCRSFPPPRTRPYCAHLLTWEALACGVVMGASAEPAATAWPEPCGDCYSSSCESQMRVSQICLP